MHAARIPFLADIEDDGALIDIVRENPSWRVELSHEGRILVSPLTGTASASKEMEAAMQLVAWARERGGKAYGAAAGFRLPDKSVLGPDASWISAERLAALSVEQTGRAFWRVSPEVVIEVMSEWDRWPDLMRKLKRYIENGVSYAVAVDPERRRTYELGTAPTGLSLDFEAIFDA
jgi:Uma2 family endonuclease